MYNYKKLTKAVIKIHMVITKDTRFCDRTEHIAIIKSLK